MFTTNKEYAEAPATVEDNLGLVRLCAARFKGRGIEYEELYSAGCMGLVKAVKAFDESRGVRFSTYAVPVILGEMRRLFRDGGTVKVSRGLKERALKIGKIREELERKLGREPLLSELSDATGLSPEDAAEAVCVLQPVVSLTKDDGSGETIELPVEPPDIKIIDTLALSQALKTLEPHDRVLIYLRYYKNLTQQSAAERLGMTQVQVSRREKKILSALRRELEG